MNLGPNQKAWIAALRSGNYTQERGSLQNHFGYCCLGVACEVAGQDGITLSRETAALQLHGSSLNSQPEVQGHLGLLNSGGAVCDEATMEDVKEVLEFILERYPESRVTKTLIQREWYNENAAAIQLTNLNDNLQVPFEGIADVLENFPHLYFKESK